MVFVLTQRNLRIYLGFWNTPSQPLVKFLVLGGDDSHNLRVRSYQVVNFLSPKAEWTQLNPCIFLYVGLVWDIFGKTVSILGWKRAFMCFLFVFSPLHPASPLPSGKDGPTARRWIWRRKTLQCARWVKMAWPKGSRCFGILLPAWMSQEVSDSKRLSSGL